MDLAEAARRMREGLIEGLGIEGDDVLAEADALVPIEEGTLSRSGVVRVDEGDLSVSIGYGSGPAAPYAVVQHEDLSLRHDDGRSGKYLERPLMAARQGMTERLRESMLRRL